MCGFRNSKKTLAQRLFSPPKAFSRTKSLKDGDEEDADNVANGHTTMPRKKSREAEETHAPPPFFPSRCQPRGRFLLLLSGFSGGKR